MTYEYTIEVLQKAAIELGGEILVREALKKEQSDVEKMAQQILFGGTFGDMANETNRRFDELLRVIHSLKAKNDD